VYSFDDEQPSPADPTDALRVIRGGSWYSPAASTRSAERRGDPPTVGDPDTGFRVVLEIRQ
jgi:formylglycine-generating enzyme required for sulfatase activity